MPCWRTRGRGSGRKAYPISSSSKRRFKSIKPTKKAYESRKCKVCNAPFILGPLDPNVDVCPLHAYTEITRATK